MDSLCHKKRRGGHCDNHAPQQGFIKGEGQFCGEKQHSIIFFYWLHETKSLFNTFISVCAGNR